MIRYDALNKDHEKYEIKQPKLNNENDEVKNKKIGKKSKKLVKERKPTIVVSKEKFYEVSTNIKDSFKESNNVGTGFSLLQAYGKSKEENEEEEEEEEKGEMIEEIEDSLGEAVDEHLDESANKVDLDQALSSTKTKLTNVINEKISKKPFNNCKETVAKGIWKETFFFTPDDPRLQGRHSFYRSKKKFFF